MRPASALALLVALCLFHAPVAHAEDPEDAEATVMVDPDWSAIGASLVPGVLVHGAGHWVRGERDTAWQLLGFELLGAGLIAGGIGGLVLTGASDDYNPPLYWMAMSGAALFGGSWFADIFGSVRGSQATGIGDPVRQLPWVELSTGYQHVANPVLAGEHFSRSALTGRLGRWRLDATLWLGPQDQAPQRTHARGSWRPWGPTALAPQISGARDGSFVEAWVGYSYHTMPEGRVSVHLPELGATSRADLGRWWQTMESMFVEFEVGLGVGVSHFYGVGVKEGAQLLLGRAAFGFYIGDDPDRWNDVMVFYDHRHDGFVAGTKIPGIGSGATGHAGVRGRAGIWGPWGLEAGFAAGSAYVTDLNVTWRFGGER